MSKDCAKAEYMSKVPYVNVVGCLMYVIVYTRPAMARIICQVCKFMFKSRKHHSKADKWIFRYLYGIMSYDIMFISE